MQNNPDSLKDLQSGYFATQGLSSGEAAARLLADGPNEIKGQSKQRLLKLAFNLFSEPMVFLLVGCGVIYMLLGDEQEAWMLLGFLGVIFTITLYQEQKAERALEALRDMSSPRALVLRDGVKVRIAGREVVVGDVVCVAEGDRVPADAQLIAALNFSVDESLLTGESLAVAKQAKPLNNHEGLDRESMIYAGTTAVKGSAVARVTRTGAASELGKIGNLLSKTEAGSTRLELETRQLVRRIAAIAALLCIMVVVAYFAYRRSWMQGLLSGLTLAMAILPNELPAVLTIFMALGAWRLSRQRVLTRRTSAIEALGTATVLCVDKTGTLTYNRMSIRKLYANGKTFDLLRPSAASLPEEFHELLEFGMLATERDAFDPMDRAFKDAGTEFLNGTEHVHPDWTLVKQFPLSAELLALSHVWKASKGSALPIAAKGAPEAILDLCHADEALRVQVEKQIQLLAKEGLRLLGVARAQVSDGTLPAKQHDIAFEFVGLVGLEDPIRAEVAPAIEQCRQAGVRVIMITGDHPETASSIAKQAGLIDPENVLTGAEIAALTDAELAARVRTVNVCARMVPAQKERLIRALKSGGEVVAMTGDGVNDAPALKQADIGIAMGKRGTDVAREAAALVLLDDDFGSIVNAISMGRRIYANLQRAMTYLLAIHLPIAGLSVIPVVLNMPQILLPVHIAFLHLIIEPACSVAFEAEAAESDLMLRPPRPVGQTLFSWQILRATLFQGAVVLVILMLVFAVALTRGQGEDEARTLAFASLVIANIGMIVSRSGIESNKTRRVANRALQGTVIGSIVLLAVVLYVPQIRHLFLFSHLHAVDLVICLVCGWGGSFFIARRPIMAH